MRSRIVVLSLFLLTLSGSVSAQQDRVEERRNAQPALLMQKALAEARTSEECDALKWLYTNMDLSDILDNSPEFWLANVRAALQTRKDFSWGKEIPQREWQHFVLPVRVNNEAVDSFRTVYYKELQQRVQHLTWRDAALEINHWCHEHMTYRPSDARTSSPLASVRNATGRCGEESTLAVAALRTVGIPARQVYTPRWAHTDDNHAWVEAYVDGKWQFLGACEPAPVLNMAWFNAPVKRGMLMNTTVLGHYQGAEQVLSRTPHSTTINVTANYAPVMERKVCVVDAQGHPVKGAQVRFGLYNYAEFYPIYIAKTDAKGCASLVTGKGDLVIWASKAGKFGIAQLTPNGKMHRVVLSHRVGERVQMDLNLTPPVEDNHLPEVPTAWQERNDHRLAAEDAQRMSYMQEWPQPEKVGEVAEVLGYDSAAIQPYFSKAEGNYIALFKFLDAAAHEDTLTIGGHSLSRRQWALQMLASLTDKDLRDFDSEVLEQQFNAFLASASHFYSAYPLDFLTTYVMAPRIATEKLTPWRQNLQTYAVSASTNTEKAQALLKLLQDKVATDTLRTAKLLYLSPQSVMRNGWANAASKGLCFVALCRTSGVPARFNEVTGEFQYFDGKAWKTVYFEEVAPVKDTPKVRLRLTYQPQRFMPDPAYYTHFTLSKLSADGQPRLMNYPEYFTWDTAFSQGRDFEKGNYVLISGTRLANGSVLAHVDVFPLQQDETLPLTLRSDTAAVAVIGGLNAELPYYDVTKQKTGSLLSTTGRGYYVLVLLKGNDEPATHILHDLENVAPELNAWGRPVMLLFASQKDVQQFEENKKEFPNLPQNIHIGVDTDGKIAAALSHSTLTCSAQLPMVILADTFNRVVFFTQGYTIGVGHKLMQTLEKMK